METPCLIGFKLTGSIMWVNGSLYTDFQVILTFYKNIEIYNCKGHRHLLWSFEYTNKLKEF